MQMRGTKLGGHKSPLQHCRWA